MEHLLQVPFWFVVSFMNLQCNNEIDAEYQETACRSARALQIPVLDIDKAITEIMALGGNSCSIQLRQIIDDAYENYLEDFERYK